MRLTRAIAATALWSDDGKALGLGEFGRAVAELEGRVKPYTAAAVSGWKDGSVPHNTGTLVAMAKILRVDPGWLVFGDETEAGPPPPFHTT